MKYLVLIMFLMLPVINPDNVKPGEWFIPQDNAAQVEANRQYHCRVLFERTAMECQK